MTDRPTKITFAEMRDSGRHPDLLRRLSRWRSAGFSRRPDGIFLSDFEQGEIGPDLFLAACRMGLEGLVSKHRDRPYRSGRAASTGSK